MSEVKNKVTGVFAEELAENWDKVGPFLRNFAERSDKRWTVDFLVEAILTKRKQMWKVNDWQAFALTSVGPDGEYVTFEACAGKDLPEWYDDLGEELEQWAKHQIGAKRVFGMARPGWTKAFKARGFKEIHREFVKELD